MKSLLTTLFSILIFNATGFAKSQEPKLQCPEPSAIVISADAARFIADTVVGQSPYADKLTAIEDQLRTSDPCIEILATKRSEPLTLTQVGQMIYTQLNAVLNTAPEDQDQADQIAEVMKNPSDVISYYLATFLSDNN